MMIRPLKILLSCAAAALIWFMAPLAALGAGSGFAGPDGSGHRGMGGFTGPGPSITTVEQALRMRDDTRVALRGTIMQHLGKDKYLFRDETGTITVEIDDDEWGGQTVGPEDTVEIHGKVDKDWHSVEIDVKRLIKR